MYGGSLEDTIASSTNQLHISNITDDEKKRFKHMKLPESLEELYCYNIGISELPELPSNLKILDCSNNRLRELPTLPDTLEELICRNNHYESIYDDRVRIVRTLSTLPELPSNLKVLHCESNNIADIPPLPNTLETLICNSNPIKTLPLLPRSLKVLMCYNDELEEPYMSYVRLKKNILCVRLYQLADISSKLDKLGQFNSLPTDIKYSISKTIYSNYNKNPTFNKMKDDINAELIAIVQKLGKKMVYHILDIGQKAEQSAKNKEERTVRKSIKNEHYYANENSNTTRRQSRLSRQNRQNRQSRQSRQSKPSRLSRKKY